MNETIQMLGFLALFHVIGGVALGTSVRQWIRRRFGCNTFFGAVWGLFFGGAPLFIGLIQFLQHNALYFVIAELVVFLGAIVITALVPDWFVESFHVPTLTPIAVGGLFLIIGIIAGITLGLSKEPLAAILFLAAFGGAGGFVFVNGLYTLMKEK